jgi:hypothetical protein
MKCVLRFFLALVLVFVSSIVFVSSSFAALYSFSSFTFTTCGNTGNATSALSDCISSYGTSWAGNSSYFAVSSGIQTWTVPATANYVIIASGASQIDSINGVTSGTANGFGATITGTFALTQGQKIKILVGQSALTSSFVCGNGGSFVTDNSNNPLIVAGGAGGEGPYARSWRGYQASLTNNFGPAGGSGKSYGAGGGGLTGDGTDGTSEARDSHGVSFTNGGANPSSLGGFGGGGGGSSTGGGGGGYGGGAGGDAGSGSASGWGPGYGGSSYNSGSAQSAVLRNTYGQGSVQISLSTPSLSTPAAPIVSASSGNSINVSETSTTSNAISYIASVYASNGTTFIESSTISSDNITTNNLLSSLSPSTTYFVTIIALGDGSSYLSSAESPQSQVITLAGISSIYLSISGGNNPPKKLGITIISASINTGGVVTFFYNWRPLHCVPLTVVNAGSTVTCAWKPITTGLTSITAKLVPTSGSYSSSTSQPIFLTVGKR